MQTFFQQIINDARQDVKDTDFFRNKGFSTSLINRFYLGFLEKGLLPYSHQIDEEPEVLECYKYVIPCLAPDDSVLYLQFRSDGQTARRKFAFELNPTYYLGSYDKALWNHQHLYRKTYDVPLFIAETWSDALSLEEIGYPALALNRIVNVSSLWSVCRRIDTISKRKFISICDNDYYGNIGNRNVKKMFDNLGCHIQVFDHFPDGIKDCNEWLRQERDTFIKTVGQFVEIVGEVKAKKKGSCQ